MEDVNWIKVTNYKKHNNDLKKKKIIKETNKWKILKKETPHIIVPIRAKKLQYKLNIDNLEYKLLSEEFIKYQQIGWKYVKVLKSVDIKEIKYDLCKDNISYSILELNNKWNDCVLFKMDTNISNLDSNLPEKE
jgi:hypothetical protein